MSIGLNTHLAVLKLSGNSPLSKKSLLRKLCIGLKHSSSIEKLFIGNVPLQNSGMNILRKNLKNMNIEKLDIQNNNISSKSFIKFIHDLPFALNTLIATYNNFDDSKILKEIGNMLMTQRNLRQLNISYCLNFLNISLGNEEKHGQSYLDFLMTKMNSTIPKVHTVCGHQNLKHFLPLLF